MLNWIYDCEVAYVMYPYMTFEDGTEDRVENVGVRVTP